MANKYIVRYPIKDAESKVIGYEILYHGENTLYGDEPAQKETKVNEFAVADTIYSFLTQNTEKVKGSLNFMTFTTTLLMKKVPHLFDKTDLVIQIEDSVLVHPLAMHFVQMFKKEGYRIAVNDFQFAPRYLSIMDQIDFIKLNFQSMNDVSIRNIVELAGSMGKLCVATGIDNDGLYQKALGYRVYAMEGAAIAERMATPVRGSSYLKSNFFRLLIAVTKDEPDFAEIENIISMDVTLSYALLRMANTVQFATRSRTTTVHQAIVNLGISQLQRWVYLLSASNDQGEIDPFFEEFLKLSFLRANFCSQLLNYMKNPPLSKNEAYLMGMFSTLPYLIDAPMEDILAELPVSKNVKAALISQIGPGGDIYSLMLSYEGADWEGVNDYAERLRITPNILTTLYFECMDQAEQVWKNIHELSESWA